MSLLERIKSVFLPKPKANYAAGWDSYRRSRLIEGGVWGQPFWQSHTQSFGKEVSVGEWRIIVSAARKLYWNVGVVNAAIDQKAMLTTGNGAFRPIFMGADREWGKRAEAKLLDWFQIAYMDGSSWWDALTLENIAIDRDGDCLTVLSQNSAGYPLLQLVPWHQIGTRTASEERVQSGRFAGARMENGVILNRAGRAIGFRLMGETAEDDRDIPAGSAMLSKDPREIGQVRGISAFAPAILDLRDLATLGDNIKAASKLASSLGLIVENQMGMQDPMESAFTNDAMPQAMGGVRLETVQGGMVQYFTAGAGEKISQIDATHPTEAQDRLQERLIKNALLGAGWPAEFCWSLEKMGGANARIILEQVNRITADRHQYLSQQCKRRVAYAIARFIELGELPAYTGADANQGGAYNFRFTQAPQLTADSSYANSDAINAYRAGMRSMTDILSSGSKTLDQHLDEVQAEELNIRARMAATGLGREAFGLLTPNGNVPPSQP
jgi:hypothetical protein